ncbi:IS4 family transposase, partial [Thalassotalea sp. ND16A]|uniref:IS4 family transposase n=1 Tax=Thalassotalea sp. ND16A TaxID=1535422 RepID=UPI00051A805B
MLSNWLIDTELFAAPEDLSVFQKELPMEWIEQALDETNKASMRRRKLPAELVVWLVVGLGLYRNRPISEVVSKLDLTLTNKLGESVAPSAVPQARERLTAKPLEALFNLTSEHWCQREDADDRWNGLELFSIDGTTLRCADGKETSEHFDHISNQNKKSVYPIARLCALMSLRSRMIRDVRFGPCSSGEITYARQLKDSAPSDSLTIFDNCYISAKLMTDWQQKDKNIHWMTPIKSNTKYKVLETYGDNDFLVEMTVSRDAKKQHPDLPKTWQARLTTYGERKESNHIIGVISSLTDTNKYSAKDILNVYFERWEIENGYGEIKQYQLDENILLRSKTVEGIYQEIWGILIAYNLIRVEISQIAKEADVSPLRISFVMAMRYIQDELMWCAIATPGSIPKKLRAMRENVKQFILPEKRKRPKDRTVRVSKTRYHIKT